MIEADKYFKYSESKIFNGPHAKGELPKYKIVFGWKEVNQDSIDFSEPVVYSYHSRSKNSSDKDKEWSKAAGKNISSLDDYRKFFYAATGDAPELFLETWGLSDDELKAYWRNKYPGSKKEDEHLFMLRLANLIVNGKKFVMYSRGYKIIEPEVLSEEGDTT